MKQEMNQGILCPLCTNIVQGFRSMCAHIPVLVIESSVRNIGVALIVGRSIFDDLSFAKFVAFLTGYFIVEVAVIIPYTQFVRARLAGRS